MCHKDIYDDDLEYDEDFRDDLWEQANYYGMESLIEYEQYYVEERMCLTCFEKQK